MIDPQDMGASAKADQALVVSDGAQLHGLDPSRGPFLIWSRKRKLWHRRSEEGHACGYASDLFEAGLFDAKVALEYGDGVHNDAVPLSDALKPLADEVEDRRASLAEAEDRYARFSAIATEARRAGTVEQGPVHEGAGPKDIAQ